ncbi:MAG: hypothetical protein AAF526_04180 [Pseudomonadota bacterium]
MAGWMIALAILSGVASLSYAQTVTQEQQAPPSEEPAAQEGRVDPFSPEPIFDPSATEDLDQSRQRRFIPSAVPQRLPEMRLRGIGRSKFNDAPTVLLEIESHGIFVVTEGDSITLQSSRPENVIRIREISDISVVLEVGTFGEVIVLR